MKSADELSNDYLLPCFAGCVICVTGLELELREKIEILTIKHGGVYSKNLNLSCTHLIAKKCEGEKYSFAIAKDILVINLDWFFDSIELKGCADEQLYLLSDLQQNSTNSIENHLIKGFESGNYFVEKPNTSLFENFGFFLSENLTQRQMQDAREIIYNGGGLRYSDLNKEVNVYLIGDLDLKISEVEIINLKRKQGYDISFVYFGWLLDCSRTQNILPFQKYYVDNYSKHKLLAPDCGKKSINFSLKNKN